MCISICIYMIYISLYFLFTSFEMSVPERSTDTKDSIPEIHSIARSVKCSQFRKLKQCKLGQLKEKAMEVNLSSQTLSNASSSIKTGGTGDAEKRICLSSLNGSQKTGRLFCLVDPGSYSMPQAGLELLTWFQAGLELIAVLSSPSEVLGFQGVSHHIWLIFWHYKVGGTEGRLM